MIPPPAQREMAARAGSTVIEVAGQPFDLRVAAGSRGGAHRKGCVRSQTGLAAPGKGSLPEDDAPVIEGDPRGDGAALARERGGADVALVRAGDVELALRPCQRDGRADLACGAGAVLQLCEPRGQLALDRAVAGQSGDVGQLVRIPAPGRTAPSRRSVFGVEEAWACGCRRTAVARRRRLALVSVVAVADLARRLARRASRPSARARSAGRDPTGSRYARGAAATTSRP